MTKAPQDGRYMERQALDTTPGIAVDADGRLSYSTETGVPVPWEMPQPREDWDGSGYVYALAETVPAALVDAATSLMEAGPDESQCGRCGGYLGWNEEHMYDEDAERVVWTTPWLLEQADGSVLVLDEDCATD